LWRDMAQDCFDAASHLRANHHWRSCVSRAYYAAFSVVTAALVDRGVTPRRDYGTWSHTDLPDVAVTHLLASDAASANLGFAIRRLYRLRIAADYTPDIAFTQQEALEATGLMSQVFRQLREIDRS